MSIRSMVLPLVAALLLTPLGGIEAQVNSRKQYVYVLQLTPRMHDKNSWTEAENKIVAAHFARLAKATESGQVILAGRTTESLEKTFGLVIFEAEDDESAKRFMESDPAVAGNIMRATLHPYSVALQRRP
jgi:uncharacterized protein YciI